MYLRKIGLRNFPQPPLSNHLLLIKRLDDFSQTLLLSLNYYDDYLDVNKTLFYNYGSIKEGRTNSPKTESSVRKVKLSDRAIVIVNKFIKDNEVHRQLQADYSELNLIFASSKGYPIHPGNVNFILRKVSRKLRDEKRLDKDITTHIFRHTHISEVSTLGAPLKGIMERVGHSNANTTLKIYSHVTKKMESNLVDLLNQKEKGKPE